ncbi:5-methyltetrahydropteroyltriglutamate--homocysteine S-methyltransferase [bacterium]|nr:5-methyltetrahydropteroyltriglutamate--homocysteine S-methyltransferase [bacterium]
MAVASNLGFPRFGAKRELKKAVETFWKGKISEAELRDTADMLLERHWRIQMDAGLFAIPVNDFSYYDHMLDMTGLLGAIPPRYNAPLLDEIKLDTYFAMARGAQDADRDVPAMEMTKWFDTNYHYIVPEFDEDTDFHIASLHPFRAVEKARAAGVEHPRPVLVGPATYLLLGKILDNTPKRVILERMLPVYGEILRRFHEMDVDMVQLDEPALVLDLDDEARSIFEQAWTYLNSLSERPKLLTTTYFGSIAHNADLAVDMGDGLHLDLVRAPEQLDTIAPQLPEGKLLGCGVVNGRNVWRADLDKALNLLKRAATLRGGHEDIMVAPSCSLLHSPIDLDLETRLDDEIKSWMAFGKQKLDEVVALTHVLNGEGSSDVQQAFAASRDAWDARRSSSRVVNETVRERQDAINDTMARRASDFPKRVAAQQAKLNLPPFPTTTIGSFPQTREVRRLRLQLRKGELTREQYEHAIENEILNTLKYQEEAGVDVLVHGEFERNDMVEYFGEQLDGYAFTQHGWVQSYGSRGVKPPIIFGDVHRPHPMTVRWSKFAKDHTDHPVKGMLTGPVAMLQWSFVRDDQPRSKTCEQIALAIRDEVVDLEAAGIEVVQIDEPAFREGLPLRRKDWSAYFDWAVRCFRVASSGVKDDTQIHTHMCYSEFNEIFDAIAAMDADVISIEASRSRMELLDAFDEFHYPNDIGPGVWDIHSPRVPSSDEMTDLLQRALKHIPKQRLWVNPDCGLKTRGWTEVKESLANMVAAAKRMREEAAG